VFLKLTVLSFRLQDLPLELRNEIYEYALESKVIFWYTCLNERQPGYCVPSLDFHPGMEHGNWAFLVLTRSQRISRRMMTSLKAMTIFWMKTGS
jgi:hypothetical protein